MGKGTEATKLRSHFCGRKGHAGRDDRLRGCSLLWGRISLFADNRKRDFQRRLW